MGERYTRRVLLWGGLLACLSGCPSTTANQPGDARVDVSTGDASGADGASDDSGQGDASGDANADASVPTDVRMTIEFSSVALNGSSGGITMRANMTWHGNLNGSAGGITFRGEIHGATP